VTVLWDYELNLSSSTAHVVIVIIRPLHWPQSGLGASVAYCPVPLPWETLIMVPRTKFQTP